jgi:hypothetical protein
VHLKISLPLFGMPFNKKAKRQAPAGENNPFMFFKILCPLRLCGEKHLCAILSALPITPSKSAKSAESAVSIWEFGLSTDKKHL